MRKIKGGTKVYLALHALQNIEKGEELRYDYGVKDLPWRQRKGIATSLLIKPCFGWLVSLGKMKQYIIYVSVLL